MRTFGFLEKKLEGTTDPAARVALLADMNRLLEIRQQGKGLEESITAENQKQSALAKAQAELKAEMAKAAAELSTSQAANMRDFQAELAVLRLKAAGHVAEAAALRDEIAARREAATLAESTGITEEKALLTVSYG